MPSPFPGMDPYLEAHWRDVHVSLVIYARDALQESLPPELRARVEERVVLETPVGIIAGGLFPDLRVVEYRPQERRAPVGLQRQHDEVLRRPVQEGVRLVLDRGRSGAQAERREFQLGAPRGRKMSRGCGRGHFGSARAA